MTVEQAIRLLDPATTAAAIAETEYYNGFSGRTAAVQAVSDACELACEIMREYEQVKRERDAAVADLKDALERGDAASFCEFCKHNDDWGKCEHPCNPYSGETGWEWRGLPEPPEEEE